MKLTVYQPGKISYWEGEEGGTDVTTRDSDDGEKTQPWPKDMGLPVIHFANQRNNDSAHGESEIRPALPLQNVLNRTLHSMVMASELSAFKVYWSVGVEMDKDQITPGAMLGVVIKDSSGNVITELNPEQVAYLNAIKIGEFNESDISNYTTQIEKIVLELSQVTQTPIYGVTGQGNLSGEALKQLEIGLIGKVERFQRENNKAIRRLIRLAAEIQSGFKEHTAAPEIDFISISWKSPELIDTGEQIRVLYEMKEKTPGLWDDDFYRERIGGLLGMTQKQIKEEGENARNSASIQFAQLVGADGTVPPA